MDVVHLSYMIKLFSFFLLTINSSNQTASILNLSKCNSPVQDCPVLRCIIVLLYLDIRLSTTF